MRTTKKFVKRLNDSLTVLIVLGIIITVNVLSYYSSIRFDMTDNGDYSVSPVTKRIVSNLDDVITIKTYFSRNLPAKYLNLEQEISDMLDEYSNYSSGKIRIETIDPSKLEDPVQELGNKGIPTLRFNVLRNDSFQVVNGYLGLIVEYGSENQVIPVIDSTKTLEYELTMAIKKLTADGLPTLGIVTSGGDSSLQGISQATDRLKQLYQIKTIDLSAQEVSSDVSALLVIGLNKKVDEKVAKKIDSFVMSGKPVMFLLDGVLVNPQTGAVKNDLGLSELLSAYGADIKNDLIADVSNGRASFSAPAASYYLTYQINYPLWPKVLPENMDKDNVIVAGLSSIIMPWTSSLELHPAEGRNIDVLAKTTDKAISQVDSYNLEPDGAFVSGAETKQYDLAALITGKVESPFGQGQTDNAKIIVVGDSDFVSDNFSGPASDNLTFFQNIVDSLALDSDLINIRSKGAVERPIKPISNVAKETVRYLNILGLSVLALIFGFVRYFLRRRNRRGANVNGPWFKRFFGGIGSLFSGIAKAVSSRLKKKKDEPPVKAEEATTQTVESPAVTTPADGSNAQTNIEDSVKKN